MCWESSGVVGFDLGPLLQGQMRIAKLKSAYNSLIIDSTATIVRWFGIFGHFRWNRYPRTAWWQTKVRESHLCLCLHQNIYKICEIYTKTEFNASNDYCTGK